MAQFNYKLRKDQVSETRPIYFRYFNIDIDVTLRTPLSANLKEWDDKKQEIKSLTFTNRVVQTAFNDKKATINTKLLNFKAFFISKQQIAEASGELINATWVKDVTAEFFKTTKSSDREKIYLIEFIQNSIDNSKVAVGTTKGYDSTLIRVKNFSEYKGTKYKIREVDIAFGVEFIEWMTGEHYTSNVISKTIKNLKQFIGGADSKINVNNEYKEISYEAPEENAVDDIYLTAVEIALIEKYRPESPFLEQARKLLLVGLKTGLRVSDLMRLNNPKDFYRKGKELSRPQIKNNNLTLTTIKTGQKCVIPLHPSIRELINEIEPMLDQKFNKRVKKIAQEIGLTGLTYGSLVVNLNAHLEKAPKKLRKVLDMYPRYQLVSSHIMRRSYITNRYKEKDSLMSISAASGHASEASILRYLKISKDEHAKTKHEEWDKKNL